MGTDDLAERALLQGLIKVAAAYVHACAATRRASHGTWRARGPLRGRRTRTLATRPASTSTALLHDIDLRLAQLAADPDRQPIAGHQSCRRTAR